MCVIGFYYKKILIMTYDKNIKRIHRLLLFFIKISLCSNGFDKLFILNMKPKLSKIICFSVNLYLFLTQREKMKDL